ncbi:MAG: hypothetical protein ACRDRJ_17685 [Streptosporangiaceae bacterium]
MVKAITEAHEGSVHVESTIGQGSVFELHLPASPAWAGGRPHPDQRAVSR